MYRPHGRYRYTRGVVSLSERGRVSVLSLMAFTELARRRRHDSLSLAHVAGAHQ